MNDNEKVNPMLGSPHPKSQKEKPAIKIKTDESPYPQDYEGLLQQFRTHEIELEMQNEELRQAQVALET
jgi:hypothetical protein